MQTPKEGSSSIDMFDLLSDSEKKAKRKLREKLLASSGVKEFFAEGTISVNKRTCQGLECKLCIKESPTNALYWMAGEVGIVQDLCVYCGACVLSCIVDDCIKITRKREDGKVEKFSRPTDVIALENRINAEKRFERVREVSPTTKNHRERHKHEKQK